MHGTETTDIILMSFLLEQTKICISNYVFFIVITQVLVTYLITASLIPLTYIKDMGGQKS